MESINDQIARREADVSRIFISCIFLVLLLMVSGSVIPPVCLAGWYDRPPNRINADAGTPNCHLNSGGRRIVRINDTVIALCITGDGDQDDHTYRSTDEGNSWDRIDVDGRFSGCLISGPNEMVYHFYLDGDDLYMVRFRYDAVPPAPLSIFHHPDLSESNSGPYHSVNAIVDRDGRLFVATHWGAGSYDVLYLLNSINGGDSWNGPYQVSTDSAVWYYPHLEVSGDNQLAITYGCRVGNRSVQFATSNNLGQTWSRTQLGTGVIQNAALLTVGNDQYFVFVQADEGSLEGIYYKHSTDSGGTWDTNWQLIEETCGYGDPSPALGSDGNTIYLACRSNNGTGITSGTCGDQSRPKLMRSVNLGQTWATVDDNYGGERGGCRHQLRYQTWWNYGGPVEWIWLQYVDGGSSIPTYYDVNVDVEIFSLSSGPGDTTPPLPPVGVDAEVLPPS